LVRPRIAFLSRTVKLVRAVATAHDLNLVAIEFSFAKNANALIVKRLPWPELVAGT
jgi:hypothetical protein